jgi:DNA-binding CsgD family transcriptional regulator
VSDNTFGPFHPPLGITEAEWKALSELHDGRTMAEAARRLDVPEKRLRFHVLNAAEKLRIAASR